MIATLYDAKTLKRLTQIKNPYRIFLNRSRYFNPLSHGNEAFSHVALKSNFNILTVRTILESVNEKYVSEYIHEE